MRPLTRREVRTIDRTGGTFLHTSRTNPGKVAPTGVPPFLAGQGQFESEGPFDFTGHALAVVERLGLDWLVAIGGDDTLSYAERLSREGVKVLAVPKTMDNDVFGTDYCIGFSTAVTRSVQFIHQLRTSTGSHERIAVVELFGRNCGETSLLSAYLAGVDRAIICEVPFDPELLAKYLMEDKASNPSRYAMVTVSEGARLLEGRWRSRERRMPTGIASWGDRAGHRRAAQAAHRRGHHLPATGVSDALGRARRPRPDGGGQLRQYGHQPDRPERPGADGGVASGTYTSVPIDTMMAGTKRVDVEALYDEKRYRPLIRQVDGKPMFLY